MMKIMSGGNSILGLKDRWIVCMVETSTPSSIGLSDLAVGLFRFIALRAMLVSRRSVGAILKIKTSFLKIVSPLASQSKRSTYI